MLAFEKFREHVQYRMNKDGTPMPFQFVVLGIVGEAGELLDEVQCAPYCREKIVSELGDVLWYIQAAAESKGFDGNLRTLLGLTDRGHRSLLHHLGRLAEMGKKEAWHGKVACPSDTLEDLGSVLHQVVNICVCMDITIEDAMKQNIDKLEKRYPRGFVEGGGVR